MNTRAAINIMCRSLSKEEAAINHKSVQGFTLIEILVALTILAIALTAITQAAFSFRRSAVYLQQKTIGLWVAENIYNEYSLGIRQVPTTLIDEDGQQKQLNYQWNWTIKFNSIENQSLVKADISVKTSRSGEIVAHLTGYLGRKES